LAGTVPRKKARSPLPLGEIAPIHASVACVFVKGVHRAGTQPHIF
jgi:hypothetical protein